MQLVVINIHQANHLGGGNYGERELDEKIKLGICG
ncbi:hypothetical protein ACU3L3_07870 [Priestia endophytica]